MPTIQKSFRVEETKSKTFDAFADRNKLSLVQAFIALVDAIPLVEAALQTKTEQVTPRVDPQNISAASDPKTGASGSSLLSPTASKEEKQNRDSPLVLSDAPDPLPLEPHNLEAKRGTSTDISKTSDNGLSVGETSKISSALLERLRYQQLKAEIWQRSRLETEQGIQAIREQVKRYHSNDGRRAPVDYDPDKGESDHGRPDFYD